MFEADIGVEAEAEILVDTCWVDGEYDVAVDKLGEWDETSEELMELEIVADELTMKVFADLVLKIEEMTEKLDEMLAEMLVELTDELLYELVIEIVAETSWLNYTNV